MIRKIVMVKQMDQSAVAALDAPLGKKLLAGRRMGSIGTTTRTVPIHHKNENL